MSAAPLFLSMQDILHLHDQVAPPGLRDPALLEAAVLLPQQRDHGDYLYPSLEAMAAAYHHSLVTNRPFHRGNRLTARLAAYSFLRVNRGK